MTDLSMNRKRAKLVHKCLTQHRIYGDTWKLSEPHNEQLLSTQSRKELLELIEVVDELVKIISEKSK